MSTVQIANDTERLSAATGDVTDDALVALHPRNDALRGDVERVLRQRSTLLKQCGGSLDESSAFTLDVWDTKLAEAGEALATLARGEELIYVGKEQDGFVQVESSKGGGWVRKVLVTR